MIFMALDIFSQNKQKTVLKSYVLFVVASKKKMMMKGKEINGFHTFFSIQFLINFLVNDFKRLTMGQISALNRLSSLDFHDI